MLKVTKLTNTEQNESNSVYMLNPETEYIELICNTTSIVFRVSYDANLEEDEIGIPQHFLDFMKLKTENVFFTNVKSKIVSAEIKFNVSFLKQNYHISITEINKDLEGIKTNLKTIPFYEGCSYIIKNKHKYKITCTSISDGLDFALSKKHVFKHIPDIEPKLASEIIREKMIKQKPKDKLDSLSKVEKRIKVNSTYNENEQLFNGDFDFEKLGIGGQNEAFKLIFRSAFAPYLLRDVSKTMGTTSVRGILLHGPPGCGKTLIARQLSKIVNAKSFRIVNGPEIKDKYVGESERFIRELFTEAEEDQRNDIPGIHVIIFDEFDSIGSKRTSSDDVCNRTSNDIVNQLLSKIEGVDQLNNILIIAMTNRKETIDPALLRSGRIELHIEVNLPDRDGRFDIFRIHSKLLIDNDHIGSDVDFDILADLTNNYSGAEIEALINKASTFSLVRLIDPVTMRCISSERPIVKMDDFMLALREITPIMNNTSKSIQTIIRTPISFENIIFKRIYDSIRDDLFNFFSGEDLIIQGRKTVGRNFSILLFGDSFIGKTKMIAHIISELSKLISHIRFINPEFVINNNTSLWTEFEEGKKVNKFLMVIDSLETIVDSFGVQTRELKTILGANIEPDKLVSTIVTCSDPNLIEKMQIDTKFMKIINLTIE